MIRGTDVALERRQPPRQQPQVHLPVMSRLPQSFVPVGVFPRIPRDVFRQGMQGKVRRDERDVRKERPARMLAGMLAETFDGVVGRRDGRVIPCRHALRGHWLVIQAVPPGTEIIPLVPHVERTVEPTGQNRPIDMPLPGVIAAIARRLQILGQQLRPHGTLPLASPLPPGERIAGHVLRVVPGQQRGSTGPAPGRVVRLREPHPPCRQAVEMWCGNLSPVAPQVGKPQVVSQHNHDVGWRFGRSPPLGQATPQPRRHQADHSPHRTAGDTHPVLLKNAPPGCSRSCTTPQPAPSPQKPATQPAPDRRIPP